MNHKKSNELVHESSPYLLQHAYNPVNWIPWSDNIFKRAEKENKPILISIGYSACHWCHVMEKESFEDTEVAERMNEWFICVKVDREERPDVDNLYMTAVQLMSGHGGWPLNCFALPDGRPVYGGTYFPKQQWLRVLHSISDLWHADKSKMMEYANNLEQGIKQSELIATSKKSITGNYRDILQKCVENWKTRFDHEHGGPNKTPKFPMPSNYLFLLRYSWMFNDSEVEQHVHLTLQKMANGGIYDQLHGGFSRYSTDGVWKLPHFEKMLYDNAQLVSLYAEAYRQTKNLLYKQVLEETLAFMEQEWLSDKNCFYAALDADSEGVEGKYYVWTKEELQQCLEEDSTIFFAYYQVNEVGYWEDDHYIFMRLQNIAPILVEYSLNLEQLNTIINRCKKKLRSQAATRIKPGLDNKMIASWNALAIKAYTDAYLALGNIEYKTQAIKCLESFISGFLNGNLEMKRLYADSKTTIPAFLDDYAFAMDAMMQVFAISGKEKYLNLAKELCDYVITHFSHENTPLFYYTHDQHQQLITRQTETSDNVIPSSNAQMAINLFVLGKYFGISAYVKRAEEMAGFFTDDLVRYGAAYSHWGILTLYLACPFYEMAIVGKHVDEKLKELGNHYFTNTILAIGNKPSDLPLLKGRYVENRTFIYVCRDNTCKQPVEDISEAINSFEKS